MIGLLNGPAEGVFAVRRAPYYLRAVVSPNDKRDVLDQLGDEPRPRERVFVYRKVREGTTYHIKFSNRHDSGYYPDADYELVEGVDGQDLRDNAAWRAWCLSQPEATTLEIPAVAL